MKASNCEYESRVEKAAGWGTMDQELLSHLSECQNCREVAAIVGHIQERVDGVEPGSGLQDEAARLWHVSRSLSPAANWESMRRRLLLVRSLAVVAPLAVVVVALRDRFVSSTLPADTTRILGTALDSLPIDGTVAFAGALFIVAALAVVRLALSD